MFSSTFATLPAAAYANEGEQIPGSMATEASANFTTGGADYNTLGEAAAAVSEGGTIYMLQDVTLRDETDQPPNIILLSENKTYTVDFNNHTLTRTNYHTGAVLAVTAGKVTLQNGIIIADGLEGIALVADSGSQVTLDNITADASLGNATLYGLAVWVRQNSTLSILSGSYTGSDNSVYVLSGRATITAGTFSCTSNLSGDGCLSGNIVLAPDSFADVENWLGNAKKVSVTSGAVLYASILPANLLLDAITEYTLTLTPTSTMTIAPGDTLELAVDDGTALGKADFIYTVADNADILVAADAPGHVRLTFTQTTQITPSGMSITLSGVKNPSLESQAWSIVPTVKLLQSGIYVAQSQAMDTVNYQVDLSGTTITVDNQVAGSIATYTAYLAPEPSINFDISGFQLVMSVPGSSVLDDDTVGITTTMALSSGIPTYSSYILRGHWDGTCAMDIRSDRILKEASLSLRLRSPLAEIVNVTVQLLNRQNKVVGEAVVPVKLALETGLRVQNQKINASPDICGILNPTATLSVDVTDIDGNRLAGTHYPISISVDSDLPLGEMLILNGCQMPVRAYFDPDGSMTYQIVSVRTASGEHPSGVTNAVVTLSQGSWMETVDLKIIWPEIYEVKGKVVSYTGEPEAFATVYNGEYGTQTNADGSFTMYTARPLQDFDLNITSKGISKVFTIAAVDCTLAGATYTLNSNLVVERPPYVAVEVLFKGTASEPDAIANNIGYGFFYLEYRDKHYLPQYIEYRDGISFILFDAPDAALRGEGTLYIYCPYGSKTVAFSIPPSQSIGDKITVIFNVPAAVVANVVGFRYYVMGIYDAEGKIAGKREYRDSINPPTFGDNAEYPYGMYTLVFMDGNLAGVMPHTLEEYDRYGFVEGVTYAKYEFNAVPGAYFNQSPIVPYLDTAFNVIWNETRLSVTNTLPYGEGAVSLAARVKLVSGWPRLRLAFTLPLGASMLEGTGEVYYKGKAVGRIVAESQQRFVADLTFADGLPANEVIELCFAIKKSAGQTGEVMAELGFPMGVDSFFWAPLGYAPLSTDAVSVYGAAASTGNTVSLIGLTAGETEVTVKGRIFMADGAIQEISSNAVSNKAGRYTTEITLPQGHGLRPGNGVAFIAQAVVNGELAVSAPHYVTYCLPDNNLVEQLVIKHYGQEMEFIGPNVKPGKLPWSYWGNNQGDLTVEVKMACPPEKLKVVQLVLEEARPNRDPYIMVLNYDPVNDLWKGQEMMHPDFYPGAYSVAYDVYEGTTPNDLLWDPNTRTMLDNSKPFSLGVDNMEEAEAKDTLGEIRANVQSAVADKYGTLGYFAGQTFTGGDSGISATGQSISVVRNLDFGHGAIHSEADLQASGFVGVPAADGSILYHKAYMDLEREMVDGTTIRLSLDLTGADSWGSDNDIESFLSAPGGEIRARLSNYSVLARPDDESSSGISFAPADMVGNIITTRTLNEAMSARGVTPGGTEGNMDFEETLFWMQEWDAIYWSPLDPRNTAPPPGMSEKDISFVENFARNGLTTGSSGVDEILKQSLFSIVDIYRTNQGGLFSIISTAGDLPAMVMTWDSIIANLKSEHEQLMSIMFDHKGYDAQGNMVFDISKTSTRYETLTEMQKDNLTQTITLLTQEIRAANNMKAELVAGSVFSIAVSLSIIASAIGSAGSTMPEAIFSAFISVIFAFANQTAQKRFNEIADQCAGLRAYLKNYVARHRKIQEQEINWKFDPSGYVYSGIEENKLPDVQMTIWVAEDEQGTNARIWAEAEDYGEVNPQYTDQVGFYAWAVPMGWWQVRAEKEGYYPTQSEWLPVLPEQLGVNLAMSPVVGKDESVCIRINNNLTKRQGK
ncbi:MAG: hypothetical protein FWF06_01875 [Symbiobacteriaceae bacterium]|nr:hypothetical protein [Symbiobacteriaceae bacterium]